MSRIVVSRVRGNVSSTTIHAVPPRLTNSTVSSNTLVLGLGLYNWQADRLSDPRIPAFLHHWCIRYSWLFSCMYWYRTHPGPGLDARFMHVFSWTIIAPLRQDQYSVQSTLRMPGYRVYITPSHNHNQDQYRVRLHYYMPGSDSMELRWTGGSGLYILALLAAAVASLLLVLGTEYSIGYRAFILHALCYHSTPV